MKKIFIVIPNWNGADLITECLNSLQKQTEKHQIIVVDNGSKDDSIKIIEKEFSNVKLIKLQENTGFAGGVNTGIKYALDQNADFIALFNNDAIADNYWLEKLLVAAKSHPEVGIVTGKFKRINKKHLDSTGDFYSVWGIPFPRGRNEADKGQYDKPEQVFAASGGASLYKAKLFREIGLFDEDFFAYLEDVDISFRARLAGWQIWYEPRAVAYHHVGATSSKMGNFARYHFVKNFIYLYCKNMPGWLFWKYKPRFLYQLVRFGAGAVRDGQIGFYMKAIGVAILHMPGTLVKRHAIQSRRKVSASAIDKLLYKQRPPKIPNVVDN